MKEKGVIDSVTAYRTEWRRIVTREKGKIIMNIPITKLSTAFIYLQQFCR